MRLLLIVTVFALCSSLSAEPTTKPKAKGPEPLPTMADIRAKSEAGDHPATLKLLARVLPLKGSAANAYDRYELLTLRGESQLRLKQVKSAAESFKLAAEATKEPRDAAVARATERTLREAKDYRVQRRFALKEGPNSADILDPKQRPAAMRIVYDDLRQTIEPKVKAAKVARELPPISETFDQLGVLQDFELALTGQEDSQRTARDELGVRRARDLIAKELDKMNQDATKIYDIANEIIAERYTDDSIDTSSSRTSARGSARPPVAGGTSSGTAVTFRRGLSKTATKELNDIVATCRKVVPVIDSLAKSTTSVTPEDADDLVRKAKSVAANAERVLNTRYTSRQ